MQSHQIGKDHEDRIAALLKEWGGSFTRQRAIHSIHGTKLDLDFWIPQGPTSPPIIIEAKTFGVDAKSLANSRKRKVQEAVWLLIQVRQYCEETKEARIILVTGKNPFLDEQQRFLKDVIGQDFFIVTIEETDELKRLVQ